MTETTSETADTTDAEVAAALGIGEDTDQEQDEQEGSADQESEDAEVVAERDRLKIEVATLRREAAERRVRDKQQAAKASSANIPKRPTSKQPARQASPKRNRSTASAWQVRRYGQPSPASCPRTSSAKSSRISTSPAT